MARKPCIATGLLPLGLRLSPRNATGFHPSHPIDPVDFRLMGADTGLHQYRSPIQGLRHLASSNHCSKRTLWIRPAVVCHPPKRMADTTVLPSLVLRRLAPVNTNCWQPRGQKPDRRLRFDQKLPRFTYRTPFHLCTSTSVAGGFWCRPSSPMAGTPYALFSVRPAALDSRVLGRFSRFTITGGRGCCCQLLPRLAPKQVSGKPAP